MEVIPCLVPRVSRTASDPRPRGPTAPRPHGPTAPRPHGPTSRGADGQLQLPPRGRPAQRAPGALPRRRGERAAACVGRWIGVGRWIALGVDGLGRGRSPRNPNGPKKMGQPEKNTHFD